MSGRPFGGCPGNGDKQAWLNYKTTMNKTVSKPAVLVASICVAIAWSIMLGVLLSLFGICIGLACGMPSKASLPKGGDIVLFGGYALLILSGLVYLIIALCLRCPFCGYKFLKNPKGLGPGNFSYHPSCPKLPGLNRWAYQVARFLGTGQMRCIKCGEELFKFR